MSNPHPSTHAPGTSLQHDAAHPDTARADVLHPATLHLAEAHGEAVPHRSRRRSAVRPAHLAEPRSTASGVRRRAFQRCSAVVATLMLGTTQCDAVRPDAPDQPAATTTSATTPPSPTHPAPGDADVTITADVVHGPEGTAEHGRCTQFEHLLAEYAPPSGWDVQRMSRLAWRESNCWPAIRSRTSDTGLLQINDVNLAYLTRELGEPVDRYTLTDPVQNVRAAAALCTYWARNGSTCYQPWQATDR